MCDLRLKLVWQLPLTVALATVVGQLIAETEQASRGKAPVSHAAGNRLFTRAVLPTLKAKCFACHGDDLDAIEGGLNITTRESLLRGGESGAPAIVPGDADGSLLMQAIRWEGLEMPPKENDRLTEQQVTAIEQWIASGAVWPSNEVQQAIQVEARATAQTNEGLIVETSGGLSDEWTYRRYRPENLWAYKPLAKPKVNNHSRNPIDEFINRKLHEAGLPISPEAQPRDLIRRLTFDLTGLPPTPSEVKTFLEACRVEPNNAWAEAIDRLLRSPHYGEQSARHWLDVVRYADTSGFSNDFERSNAWRYRDYVIRSFNNDKPFNQFILEQLAGDELDADDPEMQVAVGFLRMGPWEHTSMSVARETRQQFLDDVTDAVGQVFLAHPLQCCRCHDHKFDPLPTRDYYALQAVFATTQPADVDTNWLAEENRQNLQHDRRIHRQKLEWNAEHIRKYKRKMLKEEGRWFAERGLPYNTRAEAKKAGAPLEHIPEHRVGLTPNDLGTERAHRKWRSRFEWEKQRFEPVALGVYNGKTNLGKAYNRRRPVPKDPMSKGELEQTAILTGGDPYAPAEVVNPDVLSVISKSDGLPANIPTTAQGRRLALAHWIADEHNPLTPRVIINRIWQTHFGRGLAGTPNNFGAMGKKPTHPELLDYLATQLIESGWSIKHIHRLILTSDAYRRSTLHPAPQQLATVDPNNNFYSVFNPRRLTAEELRDASLAISGELNKEMGGIPARPDMNLEAALQPRMLMGSFAPAYVPHALPSQRNRRTIYAKKIRGQRDPFMEVFNQPTPDLSCELRDESNVTPQVFALMNGQESLERSLALSKRLLASTDSDQAAVKQLFLLSYSRLPSRLELSSAMDHWRRMQRIEQQAQYDPIQYPTQITRKANEENSGQPFELTERLFEYDEYVPDVEPHTVDARTRGLANVCLAILNSNEFVFVY